MAHNHFPDRSDTVSDLVLPHIIDMEHDGHGPQPRTPPQNTVGGSPSSFDGTRQDDLLQAELPGNSDFRDNAAATRQDNDEQRLDYRQFHTGWSDEEDGEEAFGRSWESHQTKKQAEKVAKNKKSPKRSDNGGENFESSIRSKKPRSSLFGGTDIEVEVGKQFDNTLAPATPGYGIGNRMSSLNLGQQRDWDNSLGGRIDTGFDLACSSVGSVCDSPIASDDELVIPPDLQAPYELRRNIDRKKTFTNIDTDKSGNWDPELEAKERAAKLVRAKVAKREKKEKNRKRKGKGEASRDYVIKCIVKLHFDAFGNVRNATDDEQNWPKDWSEIDSEQERELEQYCQIYRTHTPDRELQFPLEDPAGEVDDLTGYPAARGCKQCRKHKQPCSMVRNGNYPCEECIEDGSECQPIQEPILKEPCKQCDQANQGVCSFKDDPEQPICNHCADNDHLCEALPPLGYKAPRIDLDAIVYGPDRPHIACTVCRTLKRRCNLRSKKDKPPCKYCKKNVLGCTFVDLPKQHTEKQAVDEKRLVESIAPEVAKPDSHLFTAEDLADMNRRDDHVLPREPTPEIQMQDAEGNIGMLTKVSTSFAHPIRFSIGDTIFPECNFCELPLFGMVAYFEKEVHVIRWQSGLGYSEVGGGHCQDTGETTMCTECVNQRLQILVCPGHQIERLPDAASDFDALTEDLTQAEPGGADMQYQLSRWCSMCFSPAAFGCSTVQPDLLGEEERMIAGCHLRLCVACETALQTDFGGDFDQMATEFDTQPKIREVDEALGNKVEGRPRADVGFLMQSGLLMRRIQAES